MKRGDGDFCLPDCSQGVRCVSRPGGKPGGTMDGQGFRGVFSLKPSVQNRKAKGKIWKRFQLQNFCWNGQKWRKSPCSCASLEAVPLKAGRPDVSLRLLTVNRAHLEIPQRLQITSPLLVASAPPHHHRYRSQIRLFPGQTVNLVLWPNTSPPASNRKFIC